MTFSELAVSTVILGISTQLSLQGWSRSAALPRICLSAISS